MAKTKLDPEEQELLEAYESEEFESDLDADRREYLARAAEALKRAVPSALAGVDSPTQ